MKRLRIFSIILAVIFLTSLLTACGDAAEQEVAAPAEAEQSAEAPVEDEQSVEDEQVAEGEQPAEAPVEGAYTVDSGFRPSTNGFSFENYGDQAVTAGGEAFPVASLTPAEVRRMFGDGVCAGNIQGDTCTLSPPAAQWMEQNNASMSGGHCEGFAVLSQLMYSGEVDPANFGGDITNISLQDNEALQRELAYWWTTQGPIWETQRFAGAKDQVEFLMQEYTNNPKGLYRIGIMKEDKTGGHAITAYAVQDKGEGIYWIMVYDNNYPGQERYIVVDTNNDTWEYEASINPSVATEKYTGGANNPMFLAANDPRLGTLPCPFCADSGVASKGGAGLATEMQKINDLYTEGDTGLLLVSDDGSKKIGYENGEFVNEWPEISFEPVLAGPDNAVPPIFNIPVGTSFTAVVDGNEATTGEPIDVMMIGPGYYLGVEGITLDVDQVDQLAFDGEGDFITYTTDAAESPDIAIGVERPEADFQLDLKGVEIEPGTDIHVLFSGKEGYIALSTTSQGPGKYAMAITRIDDDKEDTFETDENEPIVLESGDIIYFYFEKWTGQGTGLEIGLDKGGDGNVDDTYSVDDAQ